MNLVAASNRTHHIFCALGSEIEMIPTPTAHGVSELEKPVKVIKSPHTSDHNAEGYIYPTHVPCLTEEAYNSHSSLIIYMLARLEGRKFLWRSTIQDMLQSTSHEITSHEHHCYLKSLIQHGESTPIPRNDYSRYHVMHISLLYSISAWELMGGNGLGRLPLKSS